MAIVKSEVRCPTKKCADAIATYGEHYHGVHDRDDATGKYQLCERCGGKQRDGVWQHKCKKCGKDVAAGELVGFFVPHRCQECDEKLVAAQRASGDMCRRCGTVSAYCCC